MGTLPVMSTYIAQRVQAMNEHIDQAEALAGHDRVTALEHIRAATAKAAECYTDGAPALEDADLVGLEYALGRLDWLQRTV